MLSLVYNISIFEDQRGVPFRVKYVFFGAKRWCSLWCIICLSILKLIIFTFLIFILLTLHQTGRQTIYFSSYKFCFRHVIKVIIPLLIIIYDRLPRRNESLTIFVLIFVCDVLPNYWRVCQVWSDGFSIRYFCTNILTNAFNKQKASLVTMWS